MSSVPAGSDSSRFVSLSDEEAVKEIVRTTVLNLWKSRQQPDAAEAFKARAVSRRDFRLGARPAGHLRLRRSEASRHGVRLDGV